MKQRQISVSKYAGQLDRKSFWLMIDAMKLPYLRLSVTNNCNNACPFCHNEGQEFGKRGNEAKQQLSALSEQAYEYIADFFSQKFRRIKFTGGEPTLATNLPEIVRIFHERGYECSMTTNGFLLDETKQKALKAAGLSRVNISLSTLDAQEHARVTGIPGNLRKVLRNLESVSKIFGESAKINFMALPGKTMPSQLVPITELSGKLGITVSFLTLITNHNGKLAEEAMKYLDKKIGMSRIEIVPDDFFVKKIYHFKNGGVWEIDDFRREKYRSEALNNKYCKSCDLRKKCTEGPYSLRISYDGNIRPCLIRKDNCVNLGANEYIFEGEENGS